MRDTVSSDSVAQDQLRAFVERIERMDEELKAINDDKKEIYAEAKGNGFDVPALKEIIKIRRQDHASRMEREALIELYLDALGMSYAPSQREEDYSPRAGAGARTREIIEEFPDHDAETGEIIEANSAPTEPHNVTADSGEEVDADLAAPHSQAKATEAEPEEVQSASPAGVASRLSDGSGPVAPMQDGSGPAEAHNLGQAGSTPAPATSSLGSAAGKSGEAGGISPSASPAPSHNPDTHFLSSKGLERLHGCQRPETCAAASPRNKLCFSCSVHHDGPTYQPAGAEEGRVLN